METKGYALNAEKELMKYLESEKTPSLMEEWKCTHWSENQNDLLDDTNHPVLFIILGGVLPETGIFISEVYLNIPIHTDPPNHP